MWRIKLLLDIPIRSVRQKQIASHKYPTSGKRCKKFFISISRFTAFFWKPYDTCVLFKNFLISIIAISITGYGQKRKNNKSQDLELVSMMGSIIEKIVEPQAPAVVVPETDDVCSGKVAECKLLRDYIRCPREVQSKPDLKLKGWLLRKRCC